MNVWAFLANDHANIRELLSEIIKTGAADRTRREGLFQELRSQIEAHTEVEERVFYPALVKFDRVVPMLAEALDEHEEMQRLLEELDELPKEGAGWIARLLALQHLMQEHIRKEETGIVPEAQRVVGGGSTQRRLLHRMVEVKKSFLEANALP